MGKIENEYKSFLEDIAKLQENQKQILEKIEKMQAVLDNIEKDIYSEDGFDFEIICPYCNYEFIIDLDENKTEVECPECKNTIELDWTGDVDNQSNDCSGSCHGCHGCDDEEDDM